MAIQLSGNTVIHDNQNVQVSGVTTASSFVGDGSQLTNLPASGGTLEATASGTLEDGSKVIVNADGTVSVVAQTETTGPGFGSAETFSSSAISTGQGTAAVYDSVNNRVIVAFTHNASGWKGRAVVGTVSGTSITFGSAVTFSNDYTIRFGMAYGNGKVVITYAYNGVNGTAVVGTVSGNSISFGTPNTFYANSTAATSATYDPDTDRFVIMYSAAGNVWGLVATVSGTSISYGSATSAESSEAYVTSATYDTHNNRVVIAYNKNASAPYLYRAHCRVATVTGGGTNTISFGNPTDINGTNQTQYLDLAFDSSTNKVIVVYKNITGSPASTTHQGYVQVGTVNSSNNTISLGSQVSFHSAEIQELSATFDSTNNKVVIAFADASLYGKVITGTVSGTSISFDTAATFRAGQTNFHSIVFDSNSGKSVVFYKNGSGDIGDAIVFQPSGFPVPQIGSDVQFESGSTMYTSSAYDSTNGKVVVGYRDSAAGTGSAVVGTVSGTGISFGSPVVFESQASQDVAVEFVGSGKVVIAYQDGGHPYYGKAIVGTISGTSISFGAEATFESSNSSHIGLAYDSSNDKLVIAYRNGGNSGYGKAIVGTVSGTSISFGSSTTFRYQSIYWVSAVYDSTNGKVVVVYRDDGNSSYGTALVGTVSGTSISFGAVSIFESATTHYTSATFDSANGKVVIAYQDDGNSSYGTAVVGEVSGTSISFGTPVTFNTSNAMYISATYDSTNGKVVITYKDNGKNDHGYASVGTVSGTSISFGSPFAFNSAQTTYTSAVYDSNNQKVVVSYSDNANFDGGTAVVFTPFTISRNLTSENFIGISDGAYSDGQTATIQISGSIDDAQSGLTPGQKYFVQNDGTLSETADSPSVFAGTAVASTKLIING